MQEEFDIHQIFQELPKGGDLHSHFSSIVNYEDMIDEIINSEEYKNITYFNSYDGNIYIVDQFSNQKIHKSFFSFNNSKDSIIQEILNYMEKKSGNNKNSHYNHQSFTNYKILGDIFYNLIKNRNFFRNYINLIYKNMERQNILIQEIRLKLDIYNQPKSQICQTTQILDYIYRQNLNRKEQIKIIAQFPRSSFKKPDQLLINIEQTLEIFQKQKNFQEILIGIDFTGEEFNELDKNIMENKKIVSMMRNLNIQYINHAGEQIAKINKDNIKEFSNIFNSKNLHLNNTFYIIENQFQNFKENYQEKKRIGHGLSYLQYLYLLKIKSEIEKDDENLKNKYTQSYENIKNVCFEICPKSNLHFYDGQLQKEIFYEYQDHICINTDDQNKINFDLSENFLYLFFELKLDLDIIFKFIQNSITYSFVSQEKKDEFTKQTNQNLIEWKQKYEQYLIKNQDTLKIDEKKKIFLL